VAAVAVVVVVGQALIVQILMELLVDLEEELGLFFQLVG
jgi:competence protein ComGF